jgi:class 3 adenylate cyclase
MEAQRGTADSTSVATVAARLGDRFGLSEGQTRVLTRAAEALRDERDQIRRLGSLVAVGREASVIREEDDLLSRAFTLVQGAFRDDRLRLGILHDGVVRFLPDGALPDDDSPPRAAARDRALRELSLVTAPIGSGSVLTVPLAVKGRPAGVLEVDRVSGSFTERDHALVESLASQLSIALENARLYHELQGLFRQYMSPDVATALLADPDHAALGGAVTEVTVLFADLHGFTPFSERNSPERVVGMLNQYFGAAVPVILGQGGTVVQFIGDAVMAIFNAPVRQPDHALRAARAALGLQVAVESIATNDPTWPHFRVGLNTGPALVGNIGAAEMRNFTAIGDTTNLAARLQTNAEVGQVVIGESTYAQIRDVAVVRPLAPLELKGKTHPVRAYVLTGLRIDLTSEPRRVPNRVESPGDSHDAL